MALRRKLKWLGAALAALLLCVAAIWFLWPAGDSITVESYQRLRPEMSRSEVEAMLGGPGGPARTLFSGWITEALSWGPGSTC
jgi:hypothetical protein